MPNSWPYNTRRWRSLRLAQLRRRPLCRYCLELGQTTAGEVVDHVKPVASHPKLAFEPSNLQTLCKYCHDSVKQSEECTGVRRGCDVNGVPLGGW